MKLSILICSIYERFDSLKLLTNKLNSQVNSDVEVLSISDNCKMPLGVKMNALMSLASGEYVTFVDDDDMVSDDYIESLLAEMETHPDVITFKVMRYVNGVEDLPVYYHKEFGENKNEPDRYLRIPNHIMCFRRELAQKVKFKENNFGIDTIFAEEILPMIETERSIDKFLYHYYFNPENSRVNP